MNFYNIISKVYDLLDVIYFSEKGVNPRTVIKGVIPNNDIKVLDMCCGTLSNTFSIAKENSNIKVTGLDVSKKMLENANKKLKKSHLKNVSLICADATNTNLSDNFFDYIIIGLVLHEVSPLLAKKILE